MGQYLSNLLNLPGPHRSMVRLAIIILFCAGGYYLFQVFGFRHEDAYELAHLTFMGTLILGIAFLLIAFLAYDAYAWRKRQAKNAQGDKQKAHHSALLLKEKPVAFSVISFGVIFGHLCFYPAQLFNNFNSCMREKTAYSTHAENSDDATVYFSRSQEERDGIIISCMRDVGLPVFPGDYDEPGRLSLETRL